jgi:hypothetical protein
MSREGTPDVGRSDRPEIPPTTEEVRQIDFWALRFIREVVLGSNSRFRVNGGFCDFRSLSQIIIHSSVERICFNAFSDCPSLNEVFFESASHLRHIREFSNCISLCRIIIPSSVKRIGSGPFSSCTGLTEVIFELCSQLQQIDGFRGCTSLCRIATSPEVIFEMPSQCLIPPSNFIASLFPALSVIIVIPNPSVGARGFVVLILRRLS